MHRFYLPPEACALDEFALSDADAHHAREVLRLKAGDNITVLDGCGQEVRGRLSLVEKRGVKVKALQRTAIPPGSYRMTLLQAIPKGKSMDAIVQKATELGVHRIVPLISERVVVQLDAGELEQKRDKWQQTAIESIKQCGAGWLPAVELPATPKQVLARSLRFDLGLVASLQSDARHPSEYFAHLTGRGGAPEELGVWVGPEGDFTPAELGAIKSGGALPISLGPLILRSETAAIYCLCILNYEMQARTARQAATQIR